MLNNKSILVTGGTGSFGNLLVELVIKKFKPKKIIIFSRDELKQSIMAKKFPTEKYTFMRYFIGAFVLYIIGFLGGDVLIASVWVGASFGFIDLMKQGNI